MNNLINDKYKKDFEGAIGSIFNSEYYNWVESLFKIYSNHAPDDFVHEFQSNPCLEKHNGFIWEMLLAGKLINSGFTLKKLSTTHGSPDLCVIKDGVTTWFECAKVNGDNDISKYRNVKNAVEFDINKELLKVTGQIGSKIDQHKKLICGDPDSRYIVAINGSVINLDITNNKYPDILRAVYPIGKEFISFDPNDVSSDSEVQLEVTFQKDIVNKNGKQVKNWYFDDDNTKHVTGLLYSNEWIDFHCTGPRYTYIQNVKARSVNNLDLSKFSQIVDIEDVGDKYRVIVRT